MRDPKTQTKEYYAWSNCKNRARNPNYELYRRYGGRGIKFCNCIESYDDFLASVGKAPTKEHSIDRVNNNGNYCKHNIRWATKREQALNREKRLFTRPTSPVPGTNKHRKKWAAQMTYEGKNISIGTYQWRIQAHIAFCDKFLDLRGFEYPYKIKVPLRK